jgi:hypothetical protein
MLLTSAALSLGEIESVLNELDQIGRDAKNEAKRTLKKE